MAKHFTLNVESFKGLDERAGSSTGIASLPKLLNMRVTESGGLEKRCGYKVLSTLEKGHAVTAIWKGQINGNVCILAACENAVFISKDGGTQFEKLTETRETVRRFIYFGGAVYCLGGGLYRCTDESAYEVEGYIPTVVTSCSFKGAGTSLEAPNMLTEKRRAFYNGDGTSDILYLPESDIATIDAVYLYGKVLSADKYRFIQGESVVEFTTAPAKGINNIEIHYSVKDNEEAREIISACRYGVVFENRLFLYGNPKYPDRIYRSELADGMPCCEYFSELAYHALEKTVTSIIPCYNRLLIYSEDSACFSFAELQTDSLGNTYTSFPVYELHSSKGNIGMGIGCSVENTPVTVCRDGLNRWVSTAIADERSAVVFSQRALKFMIGITSYDNVLLFNRKAVSELWLCTENGTLVYNYALDCFYNYSLGRIRAAYEWGDELLFGTDDGRICIFSKQYTTDGDTPITAEFETPFCTFGAPFSVKSLYGLTMSFEGTDELYADVLLYRGNANYGGIQNINLSLPAIKYDGCRRVYKRMSLKRFYSAKLHFTTECERITLTGIYLFGKQHDGAIRLN